MCASNKQKIMYSFLAFIALNASNTDSESDCSLSSDSSSSSLSRSGSLDSFPDLNRCPSIPNAPIAKNVGDDFPYSDDVHDVFDGESSTSSDINDEDPSSDDEQELISNHELFENIAEMSRQAITYYNKKKKKILNDIKKNLKQEGIFNQEVEKIFLDLSKMDLKNKLPQKSLKKITKNPINKNLINNQFEDVISQIFMYKKILKIINTPNYYTPSFNHDKLGPIFSTIEKYNPSFFNHDQLDDIFSTIEKYSLLFDRINSIVVDSNFDTRSFLTDELKIKINKLINISKYLINQKTAYYRDFFTEMNYKRESSNTSSFNPKPRSTDPTARSSHEKPIVAPDPEEIDLEFPQREKIL